MENRAEEEDCKNRKCFRVTTAVVPFGVAECWNRLRCHIVVVVFVVDDTIVNIVNRLLVPSRAPWT